MKVTIRLQIVESCKKKVMELIELENGKWQVISLCTSEVLHEGDVYSCENYMLAVHMSLTGI